MAPKYLDILKFIASLPEGERISVRGLAREKGVSEGTAYRAIKVAEEKGLAKTIERVGTVRVHSYPGEEVHNPTFEEVCRIVEGELLGGGKGKTEALKKFLIAAMELPDAARYIEAGNLVIVGNRRDIQEYALKNGAPVLVTGGFDVPPDILKLADEKELPLISTSYDTFTTASLINRAMFERKIKRKITLVEDIMVRDVFTLTPESRVWDWYELLRNTHHTRFPVINRNGKVVGVVTGKDVAEAEEEKIISRVMSSPPLTIHPKASLASGAHIMVWQGIELLPVVDEENRLLGIISREDVMRALHQLQKQPQVDESPEDNILRSTEIEKEGENFILRGRVTGFMLNRLGVMSPGVLSLLFNHLAEFVLRAENKEQGEPENFNFYLIKPLPSGSEFYITAAPLKAGRRGGLVELQAFLKSGNELVAKGTVWVRVMGG